MSDASDKAIPIEAPEDAIQQDRPWAEGEEMEGELPVRLPVEAAEADALEQALPVSTDPDDDRR